MLKSVLQNNLGPAATITNETWELMHPVLAPSLLRYATRNSRTMWGLALLSQVTNHRYFQTDGVLGDAVAAFQDATVGHLLDMCGFASAEATLSYTLAASLDPAVQLAIDSAPETEHAKKLVVCQEAVADISDIGRALSKLSEIAKGNAIEDLFVVSAIRAHAYGAAPELVPVERR